MPSQSSAVHGACLLLGALALSLMVEGCASLLRTFGLSEPQPLSSNNATDDKGFVLFPTSQNTRNTGSQEVRLAFEVLRADLAIQPLQHSAKIWNHADEMRLDSSLAACAVRNGLRIGIAGEGSWPAIHAVLSAGDARVQREEIVVQSGLPLTIIIDEVSEQESIFTYTPSMELRGKTFNGGDKILIVDYIYRPELGGSTEVQLAFEVRRDLGSMTWERQGDVIRQIPEFDRHVFADLTASVTLRPAEFLVVGPTGTADNEYLLGRRFFRRMGEDGVPRESFFFLTPRPIRVNARGTPET